MFQVTLITYHICLQDDQSNERESNNEELKRKRHSLRSTNVPMSDEKEENLATDSSESLVTKKPR